MYLLYIGDVKIFVYVFIHQLKYLFQLSYCNLTMFSCYRVVHITWLHNSETSLTFQHPVYYGEVFENTTKATRVALVNIVGSHLNEYIAYSILNPSSKFQIGAASGVISTTGVPFDRETEDYYQLIVQVIYFFSKW